ncbi:hypothetical protein D3C86_1639230 [compost metagenome]
MAAVQRGAVEGTVAIELGLGERLGPVDLGVADLFDRAGQHRHLLAGGVGGRRGGCLDGFHVALVQLLLPATLGLEHSLLPRGGFVGAADVLACDRRHLLDHSAVLRLGKGDEQLSPVLVGLGVDLPPTHGLAMVLVQCLAAQNFHR